MADVTERDAMERRLARELARLQKAQMARLLEYLGDPPRLENVPPEFWDEIGKELAGVLAPFLERVYLEQAKELMDETPIGVDWALVNRRAVEWSRQYTYDLVRGINDTSRRLLQDNVSRYFEQGLTIGDLEASLTGAFGPVRAEMIAVTEITRAAVQGEEAIAAELREMGIEMVEIWETNDDELVCDICGPLDGKPRGEGWDEPPPAHPRCRCWTNHELPQVRNG